MASKRSFSEAMQEATATVLGPVGGIQDMKDEIKILKGNLADAEGLVKKLKQMLSKRDAEIYNLELLVDLLRRQLPDEYDEDAQAQDAVIHDVICVDEHSDAGSAM